MQLIQSDNKNIKYSIVFLFGIFLLWDLYASLDFYVHTELLGDLAAIVFPVDWYAGVLEDPLGLNLLMTGEAHAATNRFGAHYITFLYFNNIPFLLQDLGVKPLDSIYLACGLLKLLTQIGLLLLLSKWVIGKKSIFSTDTVLLSVFLCTFFLTAHTTQREFDVRSSMILIDTSIAYTIFYATSLLLLMLYLHPFLQRMWGFKENGFKLWQHVLLVLLSFVISFNGPTSSPVLLLICPLLLLSIWLKNFKNTAISTAFFQKAITAIKEIPKEVLFHFSWIILLNLYSFYLGTFNLENPTSQPPLSARYDLLWEGLYKEYIWNAYHPSPLGILFLLLLINTSLIFRFIEQEKRSRYLNAFALLFVFFVAYTSLLPLGGYRAYRPFIVRYDVIMPTTLGLLFLLLHSSYLLLAHFKGTAKVIYAIPLISIMIFMSIIDRVPNEPTNLCEYQAIEQFANSTEKLVALPPCPVLSWHLFRATNGSDSETVSKLLYRWRVIDDQEKRYYNRVPE